MREAIEIIGEHTYLQKGVKYIINNSKSNHVPYHNFNHLLTVLKYVHKGLEVEGITDEEEVKNILVAALFHDVDHSSGKETDDINVATAKETIRAFSESTGVELDFDITDEILDATEYPYKIEGKDLTLRQGIIRDADLMQVFEYNWIHQNIGGLSQELNIEFFTFIELQEKFLNAVEFNTSWGKALKEEKWDSVMKNFNILKKIKDI